MKRTFDFLCFTIIVLVILVAVVGCGGGGTDEDDPATLRTEGPCSVDGWADATHHCNPCPGATGYACPITSDSTLPAKTGG